MILQINFDKSTDESLCFYISHLHVLKTKEERKMGKFIEEYGMTILAVVVALALISIVTVLTGSGTSGAFKDLFDKITAKVPAIVISLRFLN